MHIYKLHTLLQASSGGKDVDAMLAEANALLDAVAGGAAPAKSVQESIEQLQGLGYVCDESGCVLVVPSESSDDEAGAALGGFVGGANWGFGMLE